MTLAEQALRFALANAIPRLRQHTSSLAGISQWNELETSGALHSHWRMIERAYRLGYGEFLQVASATYFDLATLEISGLQAAGSGPIKGLNGLPIFPDRKSRQD